MLRNKYTFIAFKSSWNHLLPRFQELLRVIIKFEFKFEFDLLISWNLKNSVFPKCKLNFMLLNIWSQILKCISAIRTSYSKE